jgi:hypothetical protein
MAAWGWILIAVAVVAVIAIAALAARTRRTAVLRERFGPEYERTVKAREDRRAAEAELRDRERQRGELDIKPLPESDRMSYLDEWRDAQELFVDEPAEAVVAAYALITRVMEVRGYPVRDFEGQAELVSVDYPEVVENYRLAHGVQEMAGTQQADTEDLRQAVLRYRSLFHRLLRVDGAAAPGDEMPVAETPDPDDTDQSAGLRGAK